MSNFPLSPEVVVDTDRGEAYLMSPDGGIVAVDLAAGAPAWRRSDVDKPLAVAGDLLIAQGQTLGNVLRIVTLDTDRLGQQVNEALVELPPDVQPSVVPAAHRSFSAEARTEAQEAVVDWEFVERPLRGLPGGPVEVLPGELPPALSAADPPATSLPAPGAPGTGPAPGPVAPGGDAVIVRGAARVDLRSGAVTVTRESRRSTPAELLPYPAPGSAPASDLEPGAVLAGVPTPQFLSADGRHVMNSRRVADDPEWNKYVWTIFWRDSGRPAGELRMYLRYMPYFVVGTRLIYQSPPYGRREGDELRQEPPRLRAAELSTGEQVWQQPIRDTIDREPPPP